MTASTVLVHALAGSPEPIESKAKLLRPGDAECAVCARSVDRSAPVRQALGDNFTDRSLFRSPSDRVCAACLWCCSGRPPASLRMWSIVAIPSQILPESNPKAWLQDIDGLYLGARGDTTGTLVDSVLSAPPDGDWHVSIATSGQKHVAPYSDVQHGRGRWAIRMETVTVTGTPEEWAHIRGHALALRRLGVPAEDIQAGTPRHLHTADDLAAWRDHSTPLTPYLGSPLLSLALWSITKGHLA